MTLNAALPPGKPLISLKDHRPATAMPAAREGR